MSAADFQCYFEDFCRHYAQTLRKRPIVIFADIGSPDSIRSLFSARFYLNFVDTPGSNRAWMLAKEIFSITANRTLSAPVAHQRKATPPRRPFRSYCLPTTSRRRSAQAICEADEALAAITSDYEILVIDDGSTDATFAIATEQSQHRRAVRVLRQPKNLGYGAALRRGFGALRGSLLAFTDADCQFDLTELDRLVLLAKDYDIVCGYRIDRQDPWRRKFYSGTYNVLVRALLGTRVRDCDCALKVFRREVVAALPIESEGFFVNAEVLAKARLHGKSIVEVGVTHRPCAAGESKVSLRHAIPVASNLLRFWWQRMLFPASATERQRHAQKWPLRVEFGAVLLLCAVAFLLLFSRLSYPLIEPDETRYAQIALEMVQSGNWITPTLDGKPYLDKPPLLYWATAVSYQAFGTNEAAARLPCAISAFLTVLLTYFFGKRLVGCRAAWLSAVALLLCGGFILAGRFVIMDGPLTLFTTAALLTGYLACRGKRIQMRWWIAAAVACALGILMKGPIAVVLCAPPLLAARWLSETKPRISWYHWASMAAVVLLLTVPWFVAVSFANPDFPAYFFWRHNVVRYVDAFNHQQPWWFYLPVLFAGMFPASLLLPGVAAFLFRRRTAEPPRRTPELGFLVLAACWILLFFSLSSCKLPTYILPGLPAICLLMGSFLDTVVFANGVQAAVSKSVQRIPQRRSGRGLHHGGRDRGGSDPHPA